MAIELGFLGLAVFLVFLGAVVRALWLHHREWQGAGLPGVVIRTGAALQVFMAMNLIFSLASYGLTSYEWYLLAGLTEAVTRIGKQSVNARATVMQQA